ncbi:MAG: DUF2815 family protein [Clostridia bacterium]|nr:DUF2815 family protein [Clostridia bacterium]
MANHNSNPTRVVTGKVRLSYEHLMKPYANTENDPKAEPKYSVTVLLPKSDTATKARIDKAIQAALEKGRKDKKFKDGVPLEKLPTPIYDGDGYRADGYTEFGPECKGMWVFTASCRQDRKPEIVDTHGNPIIDASEIYSGIWARVSCEFYPYAVPARQGIGCGLGNVQKLSDGEPLGGGRVSAADDFGGDDEDDWMS